MAGSAEPWKPGGSDVGLGFALPITSSSCRSLIQAKQI